MFWINRVYYLFVIELLISCQCDKVKIVEDTRIEGVVQKKTRLKWNHNEPILRYTNHIGEQNSPFYLNTDKSKFWDFVNVGDSITKEVNSMEIKVFRNQVFVKSFRLRYGDCPDE